MEGCGMTASNSSEILNELEFEAGLRFLASLAVLAPRTAGNALPLVLDTALLGFATAVTGYSNCNIVCEMTAFISAVEILRIENGFRR